MQSSKQPEHHQVEAVEEEVSNDDITGWVAVDQNNIIQVFGEVSQRSIDLMKIIHGDLTCGEEPEVRYNPVPKKDQGYPAEPDEPASSSSQPPPLRRMPHPTDNAVLEEAGKDDKPKAQKRKSKKKKGNKGKGKKHR